MNKLAHLAVASVVGLSVTAIAQQAQAAPKMEKCYGVVKKGMNDCGTSKHACAGHAYKSGDPGEWVYLPKGTCKKIVGGNLKAKK